MIHVNHENDGAAWSAQVWKRIKLSALCLGVLMGVGIVALMILSAGKGEDITGIVAPALLITLSRAWSPRLQRFGKNARSIAASAWASGGPTVRCSMTMER